MPFAAAAVRLPHILSDGAVLEQSSDVRLWGWSDRPGKRLTVAASWGERRSTVIADDGSWQVVIRTPEASFDRHSIVFDDGRRTELADILIGEVWLCSGQSNMEIPVRGFWGCPVEGAAEALLAPDNDALRYFKVPRAAAMSPADDTAGGEWQRAAGASVGGWSAVGYFFGEILQRKLGVPVGIVDSSWGGTPIESWIGLDRQRRFDDYDLADDGFSERPAEERWARAASLYDGMIYPLRNYAIRGVAWYQGCSNTGRPTTYADKLATMIGCWRDTFGREMPFYYVEIAPYDYGGGEAPGIYPGSGALLREQQQRVMSMAEHTGMVSTNDLVYDWERDQIHPRRKREVAERLALWALSDYGIEGLRWGLSSTVRSARARECACITRTPTTVFRSTARYADSRYAAPTACSMRPRPRGRASTRRRSWCGRTRWRSPWRCATVSATFCKATCAAATGCLRCRSVATISEGMSPHSES